MRPGVGRLPNLLATRRGRLAAFFLLYMAEGIPAGFTGTAIATQMRRQGLDPAVIGGFIGVLWLPWAIKWAFGPVVDVLSVERWGRRRMWILLTQSLMAVTVLTAMAVDFTTHLALFTGIVLVLNFFSATQDVAIDALAVNVLRTDERGLVNGLMFGGHYLGTAAGGAGVLLLTSVLGFRTTFLFVALAIVAITVLVPLPMREPPGGGRLAAGAGLAGVGRELARFVREAGRAFVGSRAAFLAIFLALLPMGAYALSLSLQTNLAVDLGLGDREVGLLGLGSTALSASFCILGGWLSDRFGRRRTLAAYIAAMSLPTFALAILLRRYGWDVPVGASTAGRLDAPDALVGLFWASALTYAVFQGLMYGAGTAIYMDVTNPRVAATQFTAYMALCNVVYAYSSTWQGHAIRSWGYPATLTIDGVFGLACLALLPWMGSVRGGGGTVRRGGGPPPPGAAVPEKGEA